MVYTGEMDVAVAGTAEALASTRTMASWLTVQSKLGNTLSVYVGDASVSSGQGIELPSALDSYHFPDVGGPTIYNLANIYVDVANSGEGVKFTYARR